MAKSSVSLAGRAVVAVMLFIGFYSLAIVIAGVLLFIPYAEWVYAGRLHFKLALFCIIGGGAILWAIMPRIDRFRAPGLRLLPETQPRLFAEISKAARQFNQPMPLEVYLVMDVNAWVTERGGLMGIGSRRVMGLGLPLLQVLTVSEFRGVVAHEFGHYCGGDTKLGPWIYKTRSVIERTLDGLAGHSSFIQKPFILYGNLFLRITHGISRRQEFLADELAAEYAGGKAMISGLRKVYSASEAYPGYWDNELVPTLQAGFLPPYAGGFQLYLEAAPVKELLNNMLNQEMEIGSTSPYATHPALKDRIKALEAFAGNDGACDSTPAISLLDDIKKSEIGLISYLDQDLGQRLKPTDWENVGNVVYIPAWKNLVEKHQADLAGLSLAGLPAQITDCEELVKKFNGTAKRLSDEESRKYTATVIAVAIVLKLVEQGWAVRCDPGMKVMAYSGEKSWELETVLKLFSGEISTEEWQQMTSRLGMWEMVFV